MPETQEPTPTPTETPLQPNPESRDQFAENYADAREQLERRLRHIKAHLLIEEERFPQEVQNYKNKKGIPASQELDEITFRLGSGIIRYRRAIAELEDKLRVQRPSSAADIEYRNSIRDQLPQLIAENTPSNLPIRFHGSPIYFAEDIIFTGELSSTPDRFGVESSFDIKGFISVTMPKDVATSIYGYMDLQQDLYTMPPGCLFVVLPDSKVDEEAGRSMSMGNVNFFKEPQRLFAVVTANENLDQVKQWMAANSQDQAKVFEFFEFSQYLKELQQKFDNREIKREDFVSY